MHLDLNRRAVEATARQSSLVGERDAAGRRARVALRTEESLRGGQRGQVGCHGGAMPSSNQHRASHDHSRHGKQQGHHGDDEDRARAVLGPAPTIDCGGADHRSGSMPPSAPVSGKATAEPVTVIAGSSVAKGPGALTRAVTTARTVSPLETSTTDPPGATFAARARTALASSPLAAARTASRAASAHRTCAPSTAISHTSAAATRMRAGRATAISAVTEPWSWWRRRGCRRHRITTAGGQRVIPGTARTPA